MKKSQEHSGGSIKGETVAYETSDSVAIDTPPYGQGQRDDDVEIGRPSHVVGIGASAGGLEALQKLFESLACDTGAAFVVVQHLSPDFKSVMAELLAKCTKMAVYNVEDGVEIKANTVYLIRPRKNLIIAEWRLHLSDQMPSERPSLPIDVFFRSMAEDKQHKAIGIILSGTGSDGTRGVKALKEAGGMVIVQEPSNAKFDGMPHSVINSGLADLILPVDDIGPALEKYIKHPIIREGKSALRITLDDQEDLMVQVFALLRQKSKIDFSHYKHTTIARRIERRMGINQFHTLKQYVSYLSENPSELTVLGKELLIGVTRFFRDEDTFEQLQKRVIRKLVEQASFEEGLRVWVAGCSTGEEAYSLAILIDEECRRVGKQLAVKIFATDVDADALAVASSAAFSADVRQDVSAERITRYFKVQDDQFYLNVEIRKMVIFATHNMISDPPFSNIDLVSCRNTLIYFQHTVQKKVLASLHFALKLKGILFLGASESLGDLNSYFEVLDERSRLFRKLSSTRIPVTTSPPSVSPSSKGVYLGKVLPPLESLGGMSVGSAWRAPMAAVTDRLINHYAPPCVVLNDEFQAQHVFGEMSQFLRTLPPGKVSINIQDLVVEELVVPVSTALHKAADTRSDIFYTDVCIGAGDKDISINLSVMCIADPELQKGPMVFILVFELIETRNEAQRERVKFDYQEQSRQRIRDLEQQLTKKQEHLQVTIEELETTNEELQSANEELMSANEELQSTNEELQSVNEELFTVNSEYQEKISELTQLNNDLDNVLKSTEIALLFLDEKMQIRRFTQPIKQYIPLLPSDIGRPIHHISHKLRYDGLLTDLNSVFRTGDAIQHDLLGAHNQSLQVKVMPYLQGQASEVKGVVLTVTNITGTRFMEQALRRAHYQMRLALAEKGLDEVLLDSLKPVNLLVLEDDEQDRHLLRGVLEKTLGGHIESISEAASLEEAIVVLLREDIDLCIVDYCLGPDTAVIFMERLAAMNLSTPVIVLSGFRQATEGLSQHASIIYDFLHKDELTPDSLKSSVLYTLTQTNASHANVPLNEQKIFKEHDDSNSGVQSTISESTISESTKAHDKKSGNTAQE
jgi:two-component system CheB/CheR fusion protein